MAGSERQPLFRKRRIGRSKWAEWGSEQVASSPVIANDPDTALLPYDRCMNYWAEPELGAAAFAHFLGTCRFERGVCRKQAIAALG